MNIRNLFFLLMLLLGLAKAVGENTPIDLKGEFKVPTTKSSLSQPVDVYLSGNELTVCFLECVGNLTIKIADENSVTVFSETVNSCTTSSIIIIDVQNWNVGDYCITISDTIGGFMKGCFEIF